MLLDNNSNNNDNNDNNGSRHSIPLHHTIHIKEIKYNQVESEARNARYDAFRLGVVIEHRNYDPELDWDNSTHAVLPLKSQEERRAIRIIS